MQLEGLKTMLIGSGGMLGRALAEAADRRGMTVDARADENALDITNGPALHACMASARPALVINASGYTDVDGAETDRASADRVNHLGPAALAAACRDVGAKLVHVSTDYVFDGSASRPYKTNDVPCPVGAYAQTKLAGERAVLDSGCDCLVIRTSWMFAPDGKNFVRTIIALARERESLKVVNDQRARPTYAPDLADMMLKLLEHSADGLHHATNSGEASWFDLACTAVRAAEVPCRIEPCSTAEFPRPAARPPYSVLDLTETEAIIGTPRHWSEAVEECVRTMMTKGAGSSSAAW